MATARRKTDMEGNVFTTAAVGGRPSGGGRDSPAPRAALGSAGARGWVTLRRPHPRFTGGRGGADLVYGEGYPSSALPTAAPTLPPHPCGMRA